MSIQSESLPPQVKQRTAIKSKYYLTEKIAASEDDVFTNQKYIIIHMVRVLVTPKTSVEYESRVSVDDGCVLLAKELCQKVFGETKF